MKSRVTEVGGMAKRPFSFPFAAHGDIEGRDVGEVPTR